MKKLRSKKSKMKITSRTKKKTENTTRTKKRKKSLKTTLKRKKCPTKAKKLEKTKKKTKKPLQKKNNVVDKKKTVKNSFNAKDKKDIINLFSDAYARKVLITLGGENALEIMRSYPCGASDEEISKRLKVKISDIRSTLNKMHGEGFVEYSRRKDNETGWYSYSWSLNKKNIVGWADRITKEKKEMLDSESEKYYCKKCGIDSLVGFANALNSNFKCSCCNAPLGFLEKEKTEQLLRKILPDQIKRRRIM